MHLVCIGTFNVFICTILIDLFEINNYIGYIILMQWNRLPNVFKTIYFAVTWFAVGTFARTWHVSIITACLLFLRNVY